MIMSRCHSDVFKRMDESLVTVTNAQVKRQLFVDERVCAGRCF